MLKTRFDVVFDGVFGLFLNIVDVVESFLAGQLVLEILVGYVCF